MSTFLLKAAAFCLAIFVGFQPIFGQTIYISPGATGDGSSWANASGDLKAILDAASFGDEIWVEEGTYYPETCVTCTPTDMNQSFEINNGVSVYGGFQGWESNLEQRDWSANVTILSGDLNQDSQPDSNAYSVVYFENVSAATILDGFTITDGNANSLSGSNSNRMRSGGGIYNLGSTSSNPILRNLKVKNNLAVSGGGGMVNNGSGGGGEANPRIENCQFLNNECGENGGAIFNDAGSSGVSSPEILHVVFQNNIGKYGAGVYNSGLSGTSSPTIMNCSFISNHAINYAGAIYNFGKSGGTAAPIIFNCLFYKNIASSAGAVYSLGSVGIATPEIANCTFFGNHANTGGAVYCNESVGGVTLATITNSIFWDNTAGFDPIFHMSGQGTPKIILNHSLVDVASCEDIVVFLGSLDTLICDGGMIYNEYPMFVDTTNINFRLETSSPAINEGDNGIVDSNGVLFDMDNHIRIHNGLVDMGVFEYGSQPYQAPVIIEQPTSQAVCEYDDPVLSITAQGTEPFDYQWSRNGNEISGATGSDYNVNNAGAGDIGDYTCRVISIFADTVYSNIASLDVSNSVDPDIEIVASTTSICEGNSITLNATAVNGGVNPTYEWKINGQVEFTGGDTFIYSNFQDGDEVNCRLTSSELCASPNTITSSSITIDVAPIVTPSINIGASSTQICAGETLVFTANSTNEGTNPTYEWRVNGTVVFTGNNIYTVNNLTDGDNVSCGLNSSEFCASPSFVTSSAISISVTDVVEPSINITSNTLETCSGQPVTFTASTTNSGTNPAYEWFVDGQSIGANSATFTTSNLTNGVEVTCQLSSSMLCASPDLVISNVVSPSITTTLQPTVIVNTSSLEACSGETIVFTANTTNEGSSPSYQWMVNNQAVGGDSPTFSSATLLDGSEVYCEIISSAPCATPAIASSALVEIQIINTVQPAIQIAANASEICAGEQVTFNAVEVNGGSDPIFEWRVNGVIVGNNSSVFSSSNLTDGSSVFCTLTSSAECTTETNVNSNTIELEVADVIEPSIVISSSANTFCLGDIAVFTATAVNGGTSPIYEWYVNGEVVAENGPVFSSAGLLDGTLVQCQLTSSSNCAAPLIAISNMVNVAVINNVDPIVSISADLIEICSGELIIFESTSSFGGANPTYDWLVNGISTGINNTVFNSDLLNDQDTVICVLTSSESCASSNVVTSEPIIVTVNPGLLLEIELEASETFICLGDTVTFIANSENQGTSPIYQWLVNESFVNGNGSEFISGDLTDGDSVTCVLVSSEFCVLNNNIEATPILMAVDSCLVAVFDEQSSKSEMSIYPNPTSGIFTLKYEGQSEFFELIVQDVQGRIMKKENFNKFATPVFDISSFSSGIYFIKIIGLHDSFNFKVILDN